MDLKELRNGIDDIDGEILRLFMKRMELCRDVAEYKREHDMPVFQGGREQEIVDRIKRLTGDPDLDKKFASEATACGLKNLKGHRSVGGLRASIYNAFPMDGVDALVAFMKDFEKKNG